jgi:hypothetical protein
VSSVPPVNPSGIQLYMQGRRLNMGSVDASGFPTNNTGAVLNMARGAILMGGYNSGTATIADSNGGTINMARGSVTNINTLLGPDPTVLAGGITMRANGITIDTCRRIAANTCAPGYVSSAIIQVNRNFPLIVRSERLASEDADQIVMTVLGGGRFSGSLSGKYVYESSDLSLKKDVAPLNNSLENIMKLQGSSFAWKSDGKRSIGLIAQDVQKVYPEIVTKHKDDGTLAIDYGKLAAPIIEAIKELKKENDALRADLEKLKAEVAAAKKAP